MNDSLKILTVAVPAYNVEKTLAATLASLCVEEALPELDIVVVNDGSTDGTAAVAARFAALHPGSVRVLSQQNGGHGAAVNTGIAAAQGIFFRVLDGDDRVDAQGLVLLLALLRSTQADLVAADYRKVLPDGQNAGDMPFRGVEAGRLYRFEELPTDGSVYFGIHSSTFRTALLREHGVRLQEHTFYVDTEFALLPIPHVEAVEFLGKCVTLYTVGSAGQSISAASFVARYDDHLRVVKRLTEFARGSAERTPRAQLDYIYSVLGKLCFTQYMLAAYYDEDASRGRRRAREFDAWLKQNPRLYALLGKSLTIRVLRASHFAVRPSGRLLKGAVRGAFSLLKKATGRKKLTY